MADPAVGRPRVRAVLCGLAASTFLLLAATLASRGVDYDRLASYRRLWADLAVSIATYRGAPVERPAEPPTMSSDESAARDPNRAYGRLVLQGIERQRIAPWQFWRTLPGVLFDDPSLRARQMPYDDSGRAELLSAGYRVLGGVSPFLLPWIATLVCLPLMFWIAWELAAAGRPLVGLVFAIVLGLSSYFVKTLALTRYPVGFFLVGVLLSLPLAAYAQSGARPTARGLVWRALLAAAFFAVCGFCRSSVGLTLPGVVAALWLGARRLDLPPARRRALLGGLVLLFLLPFPMMRGSQGNDLWQPLWEGLGDFDRSKGYTWADSAADRFAVERGAPGLWTRESEAAFRVAVLADVRADPAWYAGILARRTAATLFLTKLWPWTPLSGRGMRDSGSPNEGVMDNYYGYAPQADRFGLGRVRFELPIPLLLLPTAFVLLACGWPGATGAQRARARGHASALACLALGTLPLPILITTAGGQEPQAFALVYILGAAACADLGVSWRRPAVE